jgi:hypothetical protein
MVSTRMGCSSIIFPDRNHISLETTEYDDGLAELTSDDQDTFHMWLNLLKVRS